MVETVSQTTWVLFSITIHAIAAVYGGSTRVARRLLGKPLVNDDIDWRYYTHDSPDPHPGPKGYLRQGDIGGKWEENWIYLHKRNLSRERVALPPGHGPTLLRIELRWEHIVAALPLMATAPVPGAHSTAKVSNNQAWFDSQIERIARERFILPDKPLPLTKKAASRQLAQLHAKEGPRLGLPPLTAGSIETNFMPDVLHWPPKSAPDKASKL